MSTYFGGGELPSFTRFNSVEVTTAGTYQSPARCGIHTKKGGWIVAKHTALNELWFHFDMKVGLVTTTLTPIIVKNGAGIVLFSVGSNGDIKVGASTIGNVNFFINGLYTVDIHLRSGSNGLVEIYIDKEVVFSATGNFTLTGMASLTLSPIGTDSTNDTGTVWSQVIVADDVTIGYKLATLAITSQGDQAQWTGSYDRVNEIALDTDTYINAPTAGLVSTYVVSDLDPQYTNIKAVIVSALGRYTEIGPKQIDAVVRVSGVNYTSTMTPLGTGYVPSQGIWHVNPANLSPWTINNVNDLQLGIRSKN